METYFNNITPEEVTKDKLVADLGTVVKDAEALFKDAGEKLPEKTREQLRKAVDQMNRRALAFVCIGNVDAIGIEMVDVHVLHSLQ